MNYIEQINNFWAYTEQEDISSVDIAVYFAILKYCNSLSWLNPFICHWEIICQTSKVSKNAYYKSLERLESIGLIKYEKGEKNTLKKPKLFVLQLENKKGIIEEQKGNKKGIEREQNEEQKGNLYKQVNLETNKLLNYLGDEPQKNKTRFLKPKLEEVNSYMIERMNGLDAQTFIDHYEMCGWVIGKSRKPMKDWKAAVRTWEKNISKEITVKECATALKENKDAKELFTRLFPNHDYIEAIKDFYSHKLKSGVSHDTQLNFKTHFFNYLKKK